MKLKMILFAVAILIAGATVVSAQNPHMGTWKLNEAKSKFSAGAPKNTTVVYEASGDMTKVIVDGVDGAGAATHNEWTGKFDSKYYAVTGDPTADERAYTKINSRSMSLRNRKAKKVVVSGTITVSRDGKSRTVTTRGRNDKGKWVTNTAVYDKQ
jgi:hypothetical protein